MRIETRAEIEVAKPREEVFDFAVACETFPRVLLALGPLPGVAQARMRDGADPKPGALREIGLTDGSAIDEELLALDRPARHRYRWANRPEPPLGWLVRAGEGDWVFSSSGSDTRIRWTYRFELSHVIALPLALPIVGLFRIWMARGLARIRDALEARSL